jgi:hypothetical protein
MTSKQKLLIKILEPVLEKMYATDNFKFSQTHDYNGAPLLRIDATQTFPASSSYCYASILDDMLYIHQNKSPCINDDIPLVPELDKDQVKEQLLNKFYWNQS